MALSAATLRRPPEIGGIWVLLFLGVGAASILAPAFRDPENLANVVRQASVLGVLAIGQSFVLAAGMIDLSIGMIAGLSVVLGCALINGDDAKTVPVAALMLALGAAIGFVNGQLVNRLRVHPLILTFGMLSVLQGAIFTYTDRSVGRSSELLSFLANGDVLGVPCPAILLLALLAIGHVALTRTRFGLHLLAAGGDADNARRAGLDVGRIRLVVYIISGASAALGGILLAGRIGTGYPLAGQGLELDALVAVVLGGAALSGGRASVPGALAGVLLLAVLSNALNLMGVSAFVQMFIKGLIVIAAIVASQMRRRTA